MPIARPCLFVDQLKINYAEAAVLRQSHLVAQNISEWYYKQTQEQREDSYNYVGSFKKHGNRRERECRSLLI